MPVRHMVTIQFLNHRPPPEPLRCHFLLPERQPVCDKLTVLKTIENMKTTQVPLVEVDLSPILFKMQCEGVTLNGDPINDQDAALAYRRFLTLHLAHPERTLVPNVLIDLVWHHHILDTHKYVADCERIFGTYLHHDPYFGLGSDESFAANQAAWAETRELWEQEFGEPMTGEANPCASTDCR